MAEALTQANNPLIYVGLDKDDTGANLALAKSLVEQAPDLGVDLSDFGFKANQDHLTLHDDAYLKALVGTGQPVFADLKMNNGGRTMGNTMMALDEIGVRHTNVWAHAESNLRSAIKHVEKNAGNLALDVLVVTFYTRWDDDYARRYHNMTLDELIRQNAEIGDQFGGDGYILPGNQLASVADLTGTKLSPALRMFDEKNGNDENQKQIESPFVAFKSGLDIGVVGSPVYKDPSPVDALAAYVGEAKRGIAARDAA